jgi:hypothetical protein
LAKAWLIAEALTEDVASGRSMEDAADARGLEVMQVGPFTRRSTVPGIGSENKVIAHAFAMNESQISRILEHAGQLYLIRLDAKTDVDAVRIDSNLEQLKMSLLSTKRQVFIGDWYQGLKRQSQIEDYRAFGPTY